MPGGWSLCARFAEHIVEVRTARGERRIWRQLATLVTVIESIAPAHMDRFTVVFKDTPQIDGSDPKS